MKLQSQVPIVAGVVLLFLLTFLFIQAQRVDSINDNHAAVLSVMQKAQRLDDRIRQTVMQTYYERYHNFDLLLGDQRELEKTLVEMQQSSYRSFREASTGVEFYLVQLLNYHGERDTLIERYMKDMVQLKNASNALAGTALLAGLAEQDHGLFMKLDTIKSALLSYNINPTLLHKERFEAQLDHLQRLVYRLKGTPHFEATERLYQHGVILFKKKRVVEQLIAQIYQIPLQAQITKVVDAYLEFHQQQERLSRYYRTGLFITGSLLLVFLVLTLLRLRHTAIRLLKEKELAQISLSSISDGVITTDSEGQVSFMNPAAERLLGVDTASAKGKVLGQVLKLHSEITDAEMEDPAKRCIDSKAIVEMSQHAYFCEEGGHHHIKLKASPIGDENKGVLGAVLVIQDVGDSLVLAEQLSHEMAHDSLTGLLNRLTFVQEIQKQLDSSADENRNPLLWHIDLDHFSVINDLCGSKGGDAFLKLIAVRLQTILEEGDQLSRIGGDEFAILRARAAPADALNLACILREALSELIFEWEGNQFDCTVTIGVVFINNYRGLSEVLMAAKSAIDTAREGGRNNIHIHSKENWEKSRKHEQSLWIPKIKSALKDNRYRLFLQSIAPITDSGCGRPDHVEVLLRMETEEGKILPPIFIPAAEDFNLMPQLDRWVISQVCANIAEGQAAKHPSGQMNYSVNLSGTSLNDSFFLDYIRGVFAEFNTPTRQICFEITETAAIENLDSAVHFINSVKDLGCQFALDDFGSGMSSFAYLKNLPVDFLKIDGAFVKELAVDPIQYSIVEAVNKVGRTMGMQTIAEFVENDEIIVGLCRIGVDFAQGYGIDQPRPWETYFDEQSFDR